MSLLITNNPLVRERYLNRLEIEFLYTDLLGVLVCVRDHIHKGCELSTHPLSGSVKPNETIYKSVLLSKNKSMTEGIKNKSNNPDIMSLKIIEECIQTVLKLPEKPIQKKHLNDMQLIDLSLISPAIENHIN